MRNVPRQKRASKVSAKVPAAKVNRVNILHMDIALHISWVKWLLHNATI